jgi:hypothetical protein
MEEAAGSFSDPAPSPDTVSRLNQAEVLNLVSVLLGRASNSNVLNKEAI